MKKLVASVLAAGALVVVAAPASATPTRRPPGSCLRALDLADRGFGIASDALGVVSDAFGAAARFDTAGVNAAAAKLDEKTAQINAIAPDYKKAKAACRAGR